MKSAVRYLLLLLCFVFTNRLWAQNSQLRGFTIEDGLPQSQVYDMLQDDAGFLWLGTQGGGLAKFDGDTFEIWSENEGLISNYIHALHVQNDSLFIGTNRGLSVKIKQHFLNFTAPQIQQFYAVDNRVYLATKNGVYIWSDAKKPLKLSIASEIDNSEINGILFDGTFYWLATNNALWKLSALSDTARVKEKIEVNNFTSVIAHKDKVIAATFDDGVFILDADNPENRFLMPEPARINSMSIQQDALWIATDNEGLSVVETNTYDEIKRLDTRNGLASPHIRKVIRDDRDNIWIATSGGGFYKYFQNNFKHYDNTTGLKGNRIYAVHHAADGIWISSSESGLTRIDSMGMHPIANRDSFFEVKIKTLASDTKGNIWAGSDNRGILFRETKMADSLVFTASENFQIRVDTIRVKRTKNHILDESKGFPSDWVRKIVVQDDYIWAATYANGIVKFNYYAEKDSLHVVKTFGKQDGISDLLLKDMVKGPDGKMWFASRNGHLGYIKADKVILLETGLEGQTQIGTLLFRDETLFLGTSGKGIWYANIGDPTNFQQLKGAKQLTSKNIYQLIFDDQGYLWAGTERGVDKIELNPANEIVDLYHFGRNDGFLGIETCLNAVAKDDAGNLWFGAIYGLTQHLATENSEVYKRPTIYFTGVEEGYKQIDSLDLDAYTNSGKVLQLMPEQTQLGFSFRTVDLDHPKEIEYRTKLDDTEWSPWVTERKQTFAGLGYGAHTFTAQSRNHRWQESSPIRFQFFIDSPLHQKAWFQWTLWLSALAIFVGVGMVYIRRVKAKNNRIQEQLKTQNYLLTLEQKALRLQMNPHFIFNVLNGIKAMAVTKPDKMNTTINSFAVLLRETLNNSRKEYIGLDQEIKVLQHYIEVEKLMAAQSFEYTIETETEPSAEEILIPPMLIQPFVENAIRHGIFKGERKGLLQIVFHTSKAFLHCSITDNGKGIFTSQGERKKTDHQSMALTVTKERLESISGKNALDIKETKHTDGSISGTTIQFKIPLLTDY